MIGIVFACAVLSITDGDTLRCRNGTRVRLAGVDAPEMSYRCARARRCTPADALRSQRALANIALGSTLRCRSVGTSYNRVVAFCSKGTLDLSCAQFATGHAVKRYAHQQKVCA
jgi:endonuclease YncB( thermonuclease family)